MCLKTIIGIPLAWVIVYRAKSKGAPDERPTLWSCWTPTQCDCLRGDVIDVDGLRSVRQEVLHSHSPTKGEFKNICEKKQPA